MFLQGELGYIKHFAFALESCETKLDDFFNISLYVGKKGVKQLYLSHFWTYAQLSRILNQFYIKFHETTSHLQL